eukprot:gene29347-35426_t
MGILSVLLSVAKLDRQRRSLDWLVHLWARVSLWASLSQVAVIGLENLPAKEETVVYVANHTSFLDILLLSGMIPRPFKYLSKVELKQGSSMVLFAEGTRSVDGRLGQFKNGAFKIAKEAGKRIIPVSIGNLQYIMPPSSVLPLRPIRHAFIRIHPPISTSDKSVKEIKDCCFEVNTI